MKFPLHAPPLIDGVPSAEVQDRSAQAFHQPRLSYALAFYSPAVRRTELPMAYVQIEADEAGIESLSTQSFSNSSPQRIEEGPERLQFHCTRRSPPHLRS